MSRIPVPAGCQDCAETVSETDALMDILMAARVKTPLKYDADELGSRWGWHGKRALGFVENLAKKGHIAIRRRKSGDVLAAGQGDIKPKSRPIRRRKPHTFYIAGAEEMLDGERVQLKIGITTEIQRRMKEQSSYIRMTALCEIRTPHARQLERMMKIGFADHIPPDAASTETIRAPEGLGYRHLFDALKNAAGHYLSLLESMPSDILTSPALFNKYMTADYRSMLRAMACHHMDNAARDADHTRNLKQKFGTGQ